MVACGQTSPISFVAREKGNRRRRQPAWRRWRNVKVLISVHKRSYSLSQNCWVTFVFCVSLSPQCWCTRFGDWTAILNNFERDKGSTRRKKTAFGLSDPSIFVWGCAGIVIRGDWLWKAANINDKNNSAAVYVQRTVKVHNPLFSVGKLLRNKLMQRFYWSIQSKW